MTQPVNWPVNPELDLVLDRVVDVPVAKIWKAWTTPAHMVHWFVPRPWSIGECEIDLKPGGIFRTVMISPEGEKHENPGCILEVVPNKRLVFTDALQPGFRPAATPFMTAALLLEDRQGATRYTAVAMHANTEARDKHQEMGFEQGWGTVLDQLVEYCKKM